MVNRIGEHEGSPFCSQFNLFLDFRGFVVRLPWIVGIHNSKLLPARIPNAWQRKHNSSKIIVKADSKTKILKELEAFGISKQILFPELESQASEIIAQYSK